MTQHFIVGWPGAGKTTFVAAAYGALLGADGKSPVRLGQLGEEDHTYVCMIHDRWVKGLAIERTKEHERKKCVLPISASAGAVHAELIFTDVGGELFDIAFDERGFPDDVFDVMQGSDGVILFLPADRTAEEAFAPTEELDAALAALDSREESAVVATTGSPTVMQPWSAEAATVQCKAVDTLQNIAADGRRRKLTVLITKWDLLGDDQVNAAAWFCQNYALLSQYVANNGMAWESAIFGVSAQGGALEALGKTIPLKRSRVYATGSEGRTTFVAPLAWIVSKNGTPS